MSRGQEIARAAPSAGGGGPRLRVGVQATLLLPKDHQSSEDYLLELAFEYGGGPAVVVFGPRDKQKPLSLGAMIKQLAKMLGITDIGAVASLGSSSSVPWNYIFEVSIAPHLTVELASEPAVQLIVDLYEGTERGIKLPGDRMPSWLSIEPNFTVYSLIVGYDKKAGGLDLRARVAFEEQEKPSGPRVLLAPGQPENDLGGGLHSMGPPRTSEASVKTEIVSFPFPSPPPSTPNLEVKYLGLGQRFGPEVDMSASDPLKKMFDELELRFTSNDPRKLLETLGHYYRPERGWFVGAHVLLRGWELRAVFNDPALYGVEITCSTGSFAGLLIEIIYQKLAEGLGVYYGALTLPTRFRKIQAGPVTLIVPSFRLWIYTNGDFKVCVGWPLGPGSIGIEVVVFTGGAGFYFAKLRSGDRPGGAPKALRERGSDAAAAVTEYNPILEFGLGAWLGLGRSFESGPFSASLSLTLQGTFQGLLAWKAPPKPDTLAAAAGASLSSQPDYHWFAATVSLVGEIQGVVDLKVVKLTIFVRLTLTTGVAFESDYASMVFVRASIEARASLKIAFFTISVSFHATVSHTFELGSGKSPAASVEGPHNPAFAGMNEWTASGLDVLEASMRERRCAERGIVEHKRTQPARALPSPPLQALPIELSFLLNPSAVYTNGSGTVHGVALLTIGCPPPDSGVAEGKTELEKLVGALASWLLRTYSTDGTWPSVVSALREGNEPPPPGWEQALERFLEHEVSFTIAATKIDGEDVSELEQLQVALFPMFDDLELSWTGASKPIVFADTSRTYPNYERVVEQYFAELLLSGLGSSPPPPRTQLADAHVDPPRGPSLVRFVFDDWFLTLARQLARQMCDPPSRMDKLVANLGGFVSRYLTGGLRLPDPATTPPIEPVDLATLIIKSGYALGGQQFPLQSGLQTCEGTLRIGPHPGPVAASIHFPDGAKSVTSSMLVRPAPPVPAPRWSGPDARADDGGATIAVEAIPPAHTRERFVAARTRLPWRRPDGSTPFIVALPPEVLAAARERPLKLDVSIVTPAAGGASEAARVSGAGRADGPAASDPGLEVVPMLLIPIAVHLVDRARTTDVLVTPGLPGGVEEEPSGDPNSPYAPFVYRVEGTNDETRARIDAALAGAQFGANVSIALLYEAPAPRGGYVCDRLDPVHYPVVLAKANLSTTSQPGGVTTPLRLVQRAVTDELGPMSAALTDVADFLRILWELSVVRTGGFFLRYRTADGKGLPDSIFSSSEQGSPGGIPSGDTANLTLAVSFAGESSFQRWHNAFSVKLDPRYAGTLYLGLADSSGPLQDLNPCYPPGCVAFAAEWALEHLLHADKLDLYGEDWVAQLYHLIQFQVNGHQTGSKRQFERSLWSLALSPSQGDDGHGSASDRERPVAGDGQSNGGEQQPQPPQEPQSYRQVVPAYRFLKGAGESPNPYAAVGGRPVLSMRLNDIYGNALETDSHDAPFSVLYNDPLWTPAEWPGVRVAYRLLPPHPPKTDTSTLSLHLQFDPTGVIRTGAAAAAMVVDGLAPGRASEEDKAAQQADVALQRYASIVAQLQDELTAVSLRLSLLPLVDWGEQLKPRLCEFAQAIAAEVRKVADGSAEEPQPLSLTFAVAIDPRGLAEVAADVTPLEVKIALSRPAELVYTDPDGRRVPKSDVCSLTVPADLDPPAGGTPRAIARAQTSGGEVLVDVTLTQFAKDFEATFAGFDGEGSTARLAVRSDTPDLSVPTDTPFLWAVKLSKGAGIDVQFETGAAAYFAQAPLAVHLEGGQAEVPTYEQLVPTYATRTFEGIDLDAWGQTFVAALDYVLSPELATVIAANDRDDYARFMLAKQVLAQALAAGVERVYQAGSDVLDGDLALAREHFEQAALASLSAAYSIGCVVQALAAIHVRDEKHPPNLAPRLFGGVEVSAQVKGSGADTVSPSVEAPGVSVSSAKLALVASSQMSPSFLTFFVSVADGSQLTNVELDLSWRVRFAEHMDDDGGDYGYEPSEWLRVVRELPHDPLAFALGSLAVPIPVRRYPGSPLLHEQIACQAATRPAPRGDPLAEYLRWDYGASLTLAQVLPQDALWLDVSYNVPAAPRLGELSQGQPTLFQALASFNVAWPVLAPYVRALADGGSQLSGELAPEPAAVLAAVWEQVQMVTSAWARLRGIPDPWQTQPHAAAPPTDAPEVVIDSYVLDFSDAFSRKRLKVNARAHLSTGGEGVQDEVAWPIINGKAPDPRSIGSVALPLRGALSQAPNDDPVWQHAEYEYEPPALGASGSLKLWWMSVDMLDKQTARTGCWVTRNANLAPAGKEIPTNPQFVYTTPQVAFANAVVPSIVVPAIGPLEPLPTFAATLEAALAAIARAGSAASSMRLLKVACSYGFALSANGSGVRASTAMLLADQVQLAPSDGRGALVGDADAYLAAAAMTLTQLCKALDADCQLWIDYYAPVRTGASISVAMTLFAEVAGSRVPILQVDQLELKVGTGWWPPPDDR